MRHHPSLAPLALAFLGFVLAPACACDEAPVSDDDAVAVASGPADGGQGGCALDDECPFGEVCRNGVCRPSEPTTTDNGCWTDADCGEGRRCALSSGRCVDEAAFPDASVPSEGGVCEENETRFCGSKVGACEYGVERCVAGAWSGECEGGVRPATDELCDGLDNDCDGEVDEGFVLDEVCEDGLGVCRQVGVTICSADGTATVCSAAALDATGRQELCANNLDDDCDGEVDEGFVLNAPCNEGTGACLRSGVTTCSADGLSTVCSASAGQPADEELCGNDPDDDCDGVLDADEGFGALGGACAEGIGACRRTGEVICSDDELGVRCSAVPGTGAATELCGGNPDDDCDGELEEGFSALGAPCTVGAGTCQVPGTLTCTANRLALQCVPNGGGTEVCDGADNDSDTCIDEDFDVGASCAVGDGICQQTGLKVCRADGSDTECDASAGSPDAAGERCGNSLDDDCDGEVDEGYPDLGTTCAVGTGICRRTGSRVCSADRLSTVCSATAGQPNPDGELCGNNKDDNCDGAIDEGFDVGAACTVGQGICQRSGQKVCAADGRGTVCSVTPAAPNPQGELCGNNLDDDCDGFIDEGYDLGTSCVAGQGICARTGTTICDGLLASKCSATAGPPNAAGELCANGSDDDCDGFIDEGFNDLGGACQVGLGECRRNGTVVCSGDLTATTCSVSPGVPVPEVCDNKDNDCNAVIDNGCDDDGDDFCDANMSFVGPGTVTVCPLSNASTLDCNDADPNVRPNATEVCFDAKDQNCDGDNDDGCPVCNPAVDKDFDGVNECLDCDDTNGAVYGAQGGNPAAVERCDGLDNDCDGAIDENFDSDNDGYTTCGTVPGAGGTSPAYVDCNDANPTVHPFACEVCAKAGGGNATCGDVGVSGNGVDEDCDGYADENCAPCDPADTDGDGLSQCEGDCAPSDSSRFPGNPERCDGKDNDCNRNTVENCGVGDECNWPGTPSPDTCNAGLICVQELGGGGNATGNYHCTSWCNSTPLNLGLGDGCAAGETCSSFITPTANMHGCQRATDIGAGTTGATCSKSNQCRSGDCYQDGRFAPPMRYCTDLCGSDAYCGGGTTCQASGIDTGRCIKLAASQTGDVGAACSTGTNCRSGTRSCLTINSTKQCSRVCCTNDDCPNSWYCSLNGSASAGPAGGVETVPMCWPESVGNQSRPAGAACTSNSQCASEFCDKTLNQCVDLCCNDSTCPIGLSCEDVLVNKTTGSLTGQTFARVCVNVTPATPLEKK